MCVFFLFFRNVFLNSQTYVNFLVILKIVDLLLIALEPENWACVTLKPVSGPVGPACGLIPQL